MYMHIYIHMYVHSVLYTFWVCTSSKASLCTLPDMHVGNPWCTCEKIGAEMSAWHGLEAVLSASSLTPLACSCKTGWDAK